MLIQVYVCDIVLISMKMLGIETIFYDINEDDLNADVVLFKEMGGKHGVSTVLVVSMYGNPADYYELDRICKVFGCFMIDYGAQAIGGEADAMAVGAFRAVSSLDKPTAGPMGLAVGLIIDYIK